MTAPKLFAVRPTGIGTVIHIYSPGYQPGKKPRRPAEVPMCNGTCSVNERDLVPLADALHWADPHEACEHCDAHRPDWHWCRGCLGHALDASGLANATARAIASAGSAT
jgi:hypothetical protein